MGDRSNVYIPASSDWSEGGVWLYSHWGGVDDQNAIIRELDSAPAKDRWGDSSYLTRILLQRGLEAVGCSPDQATGYGIGPRIGDNEYPVVVIDSDRRRVYLVEETHFLFPGPHPKGPSAKVVDIGLEFTEVNESTTVDDLHLIREDNLIF